MHLRDQSRWKKLSGKMIKCAYAAYVYSLLYIAPWYTSTFTWWDLNVGLFVWVISFEVTVRYSKFLPRFSKRLPRSTLSHCSKEASNLAFRCHGSQNPWDEWNSHAKPESLESLTKSIPWVPSGLSGAWPYSCCDPVLSCSLQAARDLPCGNARVGVYRLRCSSCGGRRCFLPRNLWILGTLILRHT